MKSSLFGGALVPSDFRRRIAEEKRIEVRYAHARTIQILPAFDQEQWHFIPAALVDCSRHGLGLIVGVPMSVGQEFLVKLRLEKVLLLLYTVRYCREIEGKFRVGARFREIAVDPLRRDPADVLKAMLELPSEPRIDAD